MQLQTNAETTLLRGSTNELLTSHQSDLIFFDNFFTSSCGGGDRYERFKKYVMKSDCKDSDPSVVIDSERPFSRTKRQIEQIGLSCFKEI